MSGMVAALYVLKDGPYFGLDGVDPWDESRDARTYAGPHPVVAHPPCSRWCRLAGLVQARWGHKKGDDGGTFASALEAVRRWGGVLEHPAYSDAWHEFGLPIPHRGGRWQHGLDGGSSCHVEQFRYGQAARKATWLYAVGCDLPTLKWGHTPSGAGMALVSMCRNHTRADDIRPRIIKGKASRTPTEFRDILLSIARTARQPALTP